MNSLLIWACLFSLHRLPLCTSRASNSEWGRFLVPRPCMVWGRRLDQLCYVIIKFYGKPSGNVQRLQSNRRVYTTNPATWGKSNSSTFYSDENRDLVTTVTDEAMAQRALFEVRVPDVSAKEEVRISGSVRAIGEWAVHRSVPMTRRDG